MLLSELLLLHDWHHGWYALPPTGYGKSSHVNVQEQQYAGEAVCHQNGSVLPWDTWCVVMAVLLVVGGGVEWHAGVVKGVVE